MSKVGDYSLTLGGSQYVPIVIGGMGVDISTADMALEACRLGGIGHISDAMVPYVCDKYFGTSFVASKGKANASAPKFDKTNVKFDLGELAEAEKLYISKTMERKHGSGAVFLNVMEKLNMANSKETLRTRLLSALDGGIDGITLSAGLHQQSMKMMSEHPRFHDAKIGIIVSSVRALAIFLRSASRGGRLPDYIVLEGPLAGGHLGFSIEELAERNLTTILGEVLAFLKEKELEIPVIAAGGVFGGADAVKLFELGAAAVQVATRFAITKEAGFPEATKQAYIKSKKEDVVVSGVSPTGYPIRLLKFGPCMSYNIIPQCNAFGYVLNDSGHCLYMEAYQAEHGEEGKPILDKICLCHHFSKYSCFTCGANVYRIKETLGAPDADGNYTLPTTEEVFSDYRDNPGIETI